MSKYVVLKAPHPVLVRKSEPVVKFDKDLHKMLDDMKETLEYCNGLGLAAPQVGINKRVAIIDTDDGYFEIINPVLIEHSGFQVGPEGCLSIPNKQGQVKRYKEIKVKAFDRDGKEKIHHVTNLTARAFQHEMDHLDGILFTDKCDDTYEV